MHKRSRRDDNPPLSGYIDVAGDPEREGEGGGLGEKQQRLRHFTLYGVAERSRKEA